MYVNILKMFHNRLAKSGDVYVLKKHSLSVSADVIFFELVKRPAIMLVINCYFQVQLLQFH